jgi:hypothetical protein
MEAGICNIPASDLQAGLAVDIAKYKISLPKELENMYKNKKVNNKTVIFKTDAEILMIGIEKQNLAGCEFKEFKDKNMDFCAAFNSAEDLYRKLYTLTPQHDNDTVLSRGQQWIIHKKGFAFELMQSIRIYEGDGIVIFRSDYKPGYWLHTTLTVFHKELNPNFMSVSTSLRDERVLQMLISSMSSIEKR